MLLISRFIFNVKRKYFSYIRFDPRGLSLHIYIYIYIDFSLPEWPRIGEEREREKEREIKKKKLGV